MVTGSTLTALHAIKSDGKPHWAARLKAASMVFKLTHAFDQKPPEEPEPVISIDWSEVSLEVPKFYAIFGQWPSEEIWENLRLWRADVESRVLESVPGLGQNVLIDPGCDARGCRG
jgi:hypothetical protein